MAKKKKKKKRPRSRAKRKPTRAEWEKARAEFERVSDEHGVVFEADAETGEIRIKSSTKPVSAELAKHLIRSVIVFGSGYDAMN